MLKYSCHQDVKKNCFGIVGGVCNFLCSVSPQQRFEMADQCYSSFIAQSFIWQTKESIPSRHEGGLTPKERLSWLPPFIHLSPPHLEPALCKLEWPRSGCVCFTSSTHFFSFGFAFVPFLWAFPFLCLLAIAIVDSFFLF